MDAREDRGRSLWRRHGWTIVLLTFLVLLSGALRVAFNYEPAINEGDYRYAGNDDYYHLAVVQSVQATGDHVILDPLLNYPLPYRNPRPPLYDWHVAIGGQLIGFGSGEAGPGEAALESGKYALEWGSALWGALTVIPIWLLGRATFGNRAGLWAGFLVAASPAHIQRSGFGLGDHDAFIVFFLCLGAYFLVRALQLTREDVRVQRWNDVGNVTSGFGAYIASHREGLAYAFLAGVSWAAIGLSWEGFPYALAIYAVYYVLQLISNQMRRRDSTGDALVFSLVIGTVLALVIPYYWITGNIGSTLNSTAYLVAILAILSLALIPTRDLPAILVLPALVGLGLVGLAVLLFVVPDVGRLLLSANGYFTQSKLYSTIAEAQRTELGVFVFSIGFMTFIFALIGFFMALARYFRTKERALLFLVGWGLLSIYMGFAATRFIFNAAPVFAVLGGWVVVRFVEWMDLRERLKSFQSLRQESFFKATRSTLGAKQITGSLFLLVTLIVPNLWFSVDAGIPTEARLNYRQNHPGAADLIENRTGAFGQGFLQTDWHTVYGWLASQDNDRPPPDRPAHIAWWDYGFWEVALGHHPTVADNFQNGHQLAGRFLAAQSEKEAIDLLSVRLIEGDAYRGALFELSTAVVATLSQQNASWPSRAQEAVRLPAERRYDALYTILQERLTTLDESVAFYESVQAATDTSIQYFLVDNRMLPFDDPGTPFIESGSILYAPIFLANKNPDDFAQTVYADAQGNEYEVQAYKVDANGDTTQERPIKIVDDTKRCYFVSGGQLFRADEACRQIDYSFNAGQGLNLQGTRLVLKDPYYRTMFYRGFVGGEKPAFGDYPPEAFTGNGTAGEGLRHFRLVNGTPAVKLLQYYAGAVVQGTARSQGSPMAGYEVAALDPLGIEHDRATIDANGTFRLLAPFSLPGETPVRIVVQQAGAEIANATPEISRDAAQRKGDYNFTVEFDVEPGTLEGLVYDDRDRNGAYNESVDLPLSGATVTFDGRNVTTGADGRFAAAGVLPGQKTVRATREGYQPGTANVRLAPGGAANVTVAVRAANVPVAGTLQGQDGTGLSQFTVRFDAVDPAGDRTSNTTARTNEFGNFTASVVPGGPYRVVVDGTRLEENATARYRGETTVEVPVGSGPIAISQGDLALVRTEEPS